MKLLFRYDDLIINFSDNTDKRVIKNKLLDYLRTKINNEVIVDGIKCRLLKIDNDNLRVSDGDNEYTISYRDVYYPKSTEEPVFAYSEVDYEYKCLKEYKLKKYILYNIKSNDTIICSSKQIIMYRADNGILIPMTHSIRVLTKSNLYVYEIAKNLNLKIQREEDIIKIKEVSDVTINRSR